MAVATQPGPRAKNPATPSLHAQHPQGGRQEFEVQSWPQRVSSGIRRRASYWTRRLHGPVRFDHTERALHWLCKKIHHLLVHNLSASPAWHAPDALQRAGEILSAYGQRDTVRRLQKHLQCSSDSLLTRTTGLPAPSLGLAQDAVRLYQRGDRNAGDATMHKLRAMQQEDGSFSSASDDLAAQRHRVSTVLSFLEAAQLQVEAGFAVNDAVYDTIDASDARAMAVCDWFMAINDHDLVADVGCGRGRYLKRLAQLANPQQLLGIDPSESCLAACPHDIQVRHSGLLDIPADEGELSAAFAVESLEHCLAPQTAIDELCRVVRPGGHILIVDKHARRQALSQHAPWERWFHPPEICNWLSRHCDDVSCTPLPHPTNRRGPAIFLAWYGRRVECKASTT